MEIQKGRSLEKAQPQVSQSAELVWQIWLHAGSRTCEPSRKLQKKCRRNYHSASYSGNSVRFLHNVSSLHMMSRWQKRITYELERLLIAIDLIFLAKIFDMSLKRSKHSQRLTGQAQSLHQLEAKAMKNPTLTWPDFLALCRITPFCPVNVGLF
jgi:hypothetical protein